MGFEANPDENQNHLELNKSNWSL